MPKLTDKEIQRLQYLTRVNYAMHESGHLCGALHRHLRCDAAIDSVLTELGMASAMAWHYGGGVKDDLFILWCGVSASRYFHLGEAGARKDIHDIEVFDAAPLTKRQAQRRADAYVAGHTDIIIKMAYMLCDAGVLDQATTQGIFDGTISVMVSPEFRDAVADMQNWDWREKPEMEIPITQVV